MQQGLLKAAASAALAIGVFAGATAIGFANGTEAGVVGATATGGPTGTPTGTPTEPTPTPTTPTPTPTPTETPGGGACTPGFWKTHTNDWSGIDPDTTLGEIWDLPAALAAYEDVTALEALSSGGGRGLEGAARILFRAAVASLLNAYAFDFALDPEDVVAGGNDALASLDRATILDLAETLDDLNNGTECPLGGDNTNSG